MEIPRSPEPSCPGDRIRQNLLVIHQGIQLRPFPGAVLQPGREKDLDGFLRAFHFQQRVDGLLVALPGDVDDLVDGLGQGGGGAEVDGTVGDGLALQLLVGFGMTHDRFDRVDLVLVADAGALEGRIGMPLT